MYNCYSEWKDETKCSTDKLPSSANVQFSSDDWAYIGGDEYIATSHNRITNALYFPNSWYDDTTIKSKISAEEQKKGHNSSN